MATSNLGAAKKDCPECGKTFRLDTSQADQRYVAHLEGHVRG